MSGGTSRDEAAENAAKRNTQRMSRNGLLILSTFFSCVVALLGVAGFAEIKGLYRSPSVKDVGAMLLSLFAIALLIERTIAVFSAILIVPKKRAKAYRALQALRESIPFQSPTDTQTKVQAVTQEDLKGIFLEEQSQLIEYETLGNQYAFMVAVTIGLLLAIAGVSTLSTFVTAPISSDGRTPAIVLYYALDALLTAGAIGGGSAGVHAMAVSLMKFIRQLSKRDEEGSSKGGRRPRAVKATRSPLPPPKTRGEKALEEN